MDRPCKSDGAHQHEKHHHGSHRATPTLKMKSTPHMTLRLHGKVRQQLNRCQPQTVGQLMLDCATGTSGNSGYFFLRLSNHRAGHLGRHLLHARRAPQS